MSFPPGKATYDAEHHEVVLVTSSGETWGWSTTWTRKTPLSPPSPREGYGITFDAGRRQVVLFGGSRDSSYLNDTWDWDGVNWDARFPMSNPPPRSDFAMIYDAARGQVVLFGGYDGEKYLGDTWVWDGAHWEQKISQVSPAARGCSAMAYDAARGLVVLFGGTNGWSAFQDTWVWDGTKWEQKVTDTSPGNRWQAGMVFDAVRGEVVLFGGDRGAVDGLADTWTWNGSTWTQKFPAISPPGSKSPTMVFDEEIGGVLLFEDSGCYFWNGSTWQMHDGIPSARSGHSMAYDSGAGSAVLFGGRFGMSGSLGDTWLFDGRGWIKKSPLNSPSPRLNHAMGYDTARARVVLFGGDSGTNSTLNDTWLWDGVNWTQPSGITSPTARSLHAVAYDSARQELLLFGGCSLYIPGSADCVQPAEPFTWTWNGTNWVKKSPATSPTPRWGHAMAFDEARGQVVLFGGIDSSLTFHALQDTWVWDGANWVKKSPATSPPPRYGHTMAYDASRGKVVLYGGNSWNDVLSDVWLWDGTNWVQELVEGGPSARTGYGMVGYAMVYDATRHQIVLFGGAEGYGIERNDTWILSARQGITASKATLAFTYIFGDSAPAAQSIDISGPSGQSWTASSSVRWLKVTPSSGTTPGSISVTVDPSELYLSSSFGGAIVVRSSEGASQVIDVALNVTLPPNFPRIDSVINGASYRNILAPGTWAAAKGFNLASTTRIWNESDFVGDRLPTNLDGVSVTAGGLPCYVWYVSPTQVNFLLPSNLPVNTLVQIKVTNPFGQSTFFWAYVDGFSPGFFTFTPEGNKYVAGVHPDGVYLGKQSLYPTLTMRTARPGDIIQLYGTGFGPTDPPLPDGRIVTQAARAANPVSVWIGGVQAQVMYAGVVAAGEYQINVVVPEVPDGDQPIVAQVGSSRSQENVFITVQR